MYSNLPVPGARKRRLRMFAVGVLAPLVALSLFVLIATSYERVGLAFITGPTRIDAPTWSRPCWRHNKLPRVNSYVLPCARVHGPVIYRQSVDPDGDGDVHLLVLAGFRIVNLKIPHGNRVRDLPGIGSTITASGLVRRGRPGLIEVEAAQPPAG